MPLPGFLESESLDEAATAAAVVCVVELGRIRRATDDCESVATTAGSDCDDSCCCRVVLSIEGVIVLSGS